MVSWLMDVYNVFFRTLKAFGGMAFTLAENILISSIRVYGFSSDMILDSGIPSVQTFTGTDNGIGTGVPGTT